MFSKLRRRRHSGVCYCVYVILSLYVIYHIYDVGLYAFGHSMVVDNRDVEMFEKKKKTSRARAFNIIARIRSNKYCARCWSIDYLVDTHTHSQPIYDFKSRANAISPKNKTRSNLFAALLICYVAGWMMVRAAQRSITRRFDPAAAASIQLCTSILIHISTAMVFGSARIDKHNSNLRMLFGGVSRCGVGGAAARPLVFFQADKVVSNGSTHTLASIVCVCVFV